MMDMMDMMEYAWGTFQEPKRDGVIFFFLVVVVVERNARQRQDLNSPYLACMQYLCFTHSRHFSFPLTSWNFRSSHIPFLPFLSWLKGTSLNPQAKYL